MQDEGSVGRRPTTEERVPGISPVRTFLILGAVAAIIPLTILATRPEAAPTTARAERGPDFSLTDAEAIAEFERLNASLMAAYRERNVALAEAVFTSDSPMLPRVRKEINKLIESSVVSLTEFEPVSTRVIRSTPGEIILERVQLLTPHFETETGTDVTGERVREKQESQWTLRQERGVWFLHNAEIMDIVRQDPGS